MGLFRTEHMFLGDRLPFIQQVLFGGDAEKSKTALENIYAFSKDDFATLDAHHGWREVSPSACSTRAPCTSFFPRNSGMEREENPMLGQPLGAHGDHPPGHPRATQIRAILDGARVLLAEGLDPRPRDRGPSRGRPATEVDFVLRIAVDVATRIHAEHGVLGALWLSA